MGDMRYSGKYARFDTVDKKAGGVLNGADCIVGDVFDIVFKEQDGIDIAWMRNRFGADVAFFDPRVSRELAIMKARGWTLRALLSFVAYNSSPEPGCYWGEAALICNNAQYDAQVDAFAQAVGERMAQGDRPAVDLEKSGIDTMLTHNGNWTPKKTLPLPEKKPGTAITKSKRQANEKIVEMGRARKPGCYVVSWAFIIVVVGAIAFGVLKLLGVL